MAKTSKAPAVGVALADYQNPCPGKEPFQRQTPFIENLFEQGKILGIQFFVFRVRDADWQDGLIDALISNRPGHYIKVKYPLPDLVYDRILGAPKDCARLHFELEKRGIVVLNSRQFILKTQDKWRFYQLITKDSQLSRHFPRTWLYSEATLRQELRKHRSLFLKPRKGHKGEGIFQVRRRLIGYEILFLPQMTDSQDLVKIKASWRGLVRLVAPICFNNDYLIQETLACHHYQNKPFDLRVILQKDGENWFISGIVARIASQKHFLPNLSLGGGAAQGEKILEQIFPGSSTLVKQNIEKLSLKTVGLVDTKNGQSFEVELDVLLGKDRRVWLIEANSKPGHISFSAKEPVASTKLMAQKTAAYMKYFLAVKTTKR